MDGKPNLSVLLIEDNQAEAELIQEYLSSQFNVNFYHAQRLSVGLDILNSERVDVLLLDLTLPDSHGFDTFLTPFFKFPNLPVIVLTGLEDEKLASRITVTGAKGYLVKNNLTEMLLSQTIKYAIETQKLQLSLLKLQSKELFTDEMNHLQLMFDENFEKNASLKLFRSIREDSSEIFDSLLQQYTTIIKNHFRVKQKEYSTNEIKRDLLQFSYYLYTLNADTIDLLEIHRKALESNPDLQDKIPSQFFLEETKNLLIQLFGYTLSIYRNRHTSN